MPIIQNSISYLHLRKQKFISVICRLDNVFGFPTRLSLPQESVCAHCQLVDAQVALKQYTRLKMGRTFVLVEMVTIRNAFQYWLHNLSLNDCQVTNPISWLDGYNVPSALVA